MWSYIGTILNVAISAILLPFVLVFLSDDELGLWYVFAGISSLVALLDFGFTPTIARNIAYSWSGARNLSSKDVADIEVGVEVDWSVFAAVLKTCKVVFLIISLIALALMLSLGTYYVYSVTEGNLWFLMSWIVYAFAIFFNLLYGYISAYLRGMGAVAENSKSIALSKISQFVLTAALLLAGTGIMGTSVGYLFSCVVLRILLALYFYRSDEIREHRNSLRADIPGTEIIVYFRTMWHNAWRDGLVSLAMFLSTQANTLICSVVLGLASTGSYGLAMQVATVLTSFGGVWYSTVQPKMQECAVSKNLGQAARLFSESMIVFIVVGIAGCLFFVVLGPWLISVLRGGMDIDWLMFVAICFYMMIYRGNVLCVSCLSNFNVVPYAKAYVLTGMASVAGSMLCAAFTDLGLWSLILPPIVAILSYNVWKWPAEALRRLGNPPLLDFVREGIDGLLSSFRRDE